MASTKRSNHPRDEGDQNVVRGSDDDENESSSEEESDNSGDDNDSSSSESSSSGFVPPHEPLNPDQIRQNARSLLKASPDDNRVGRGKTVASSSTSNNTAEDTRGYQSYQDGPPPVVSSNSNYSQFNNSNETAATSSWTNNDFAMSNNNSNADTSISATDVAFMAMSCVAHCLSESYRAASNYYGDYHQQRDQYNYPSVSSAAAGSNHSYEQVATTGYPRNNNNYNNSYYSDSYQTKGDVMDRGGLSQQYTVTTSQQTSGQDTEQPIQQQQQQHRDVQREEEWATVEVPSSYQGRGKVRGGN